MTTSAAAGSFTETAAAGQFSATTPVSLGYFASNSLPAPLAANRRGAAAFRLPLFTAGAGNTYVIAFCTSFTGTPSSGLSLSGTGVVPASVAVGTQLNIAINTGGTWVDVGTALVTAGNSFTSTPPTLALPGITKSGIYLAYVPAAGTNSSQINLGFALVGDDGSAAVADGLQFVQIEDGNGNAEPTPSTTFIPITGFDLDGQSLTPDATRGAVVDGGNTVHFFSGIPQHQVVVAMGTVDVTAYGGDGDSIASLPNGDETIVSADNDSPLAVISGILAGTPVVSDTIVQSNTSHDGLVISNDGTVLLSRGGGGIDVFKVTPSAAHAGSTGTGSTSYTFSLTTTLQTSTGAISLPFLEDGRDGMAISPTDSSRAVVIGRNETTDMPMIQLVTGLNTSTPTISSVAVRLPETTRRVGFARRLPEPSSHRTPFSITPSGTSLLYAVTISPNGTTAYVSSDQGILTVTGVNTGTLALAGSVYSPTFPVPGSAGATCQLQSVSTIGILPDGKYLVADVGCGLAASTTDSTQGTGVMLTIPIGAGGALGAPVGQLNQVVVPFNDQMILH